MRPIRLVLICLLALGVGLPGPAFAGSGAHACAMTQPDAARGSDSAARSDAHHDHAAGTSTHHGDMGESSVDPAGASQCACTSECHSGYSLPQDFSLAPSGLTVSGRALAARPQDFHSRTFFSHWRPPAPV